MTKVSKKFLFYVEKNLLLILVLKIYLKKLKKEMYKAAEELNFEKAAEIRDEITELEKSELNI